LRKLFGGAFELDKASKLIQNDAAVAAVTTTDDPAKLPELWRADVERFRTVREKYLLYR
jgi:hypothetical protein